MPLERRIGGVRAGSSGFVYALDTAGQWLANADSYAEAAPAPVRRPAQPSNRLLAHTLGITELYVQLREFERGGLLQLSEFLTEPGCWVPNGVGGWLKPDAYLALETPEVSDYWWLEQDQATESLPTLNRKLTAYLDFVRRGHRGPGGVVPRILVAVPTAARLTAVLELVHRLPEPASRIIHTATHDSAAPYLLEVLRE
jgi:hypothetical protein